MEQIVAVGLKECCKSGVNLSKPVPTGVEGETVRVCCACGCRHFGLLVDTGHLGLMFAEQ